MVRVPPGKSSDTKILAQSLESNRDGVLFGRCGPVPGIMIALRQSRLADALPAAIMPTCPVRPPFMVPAPCARRNARWLKVPCWQPLRLRP
jgi:hypothetical protein